jgi:chromosomal replication initiator protein
MNYEVVREAFILATNYTQDELKNMLEEHYSQLTFEDKILDVVLRYYKSDRKEVLGQKRHPELVEARHLTMHMMRKHLADKKLKAIAKYFGKKDHSTVIHADKSVRDRLFYDEKYQQQYEEIDNIISKLTETLA